MKIFAVGCKSCGYNSILKSIRNARQNSKFYRRAEFLYTMRNQCGMLYSPYGDCELKILRVSVKLAYQGIYFTEEHASGDLHDVWFYWDCNISMVFPTLGLNAAKIIDYIEKCFKRKLHIIRFPAKNSLEADLYLPQEWSYGTPNISFVPELKSRFFLQLKGSKIIDCIEKCFEQKLYKIKFPTNNSMGPCLYLPQKWS